MDVECRRQISRRDYQVELDLSSRLQEQGGVRAVNRDVLTGDVQWFLGDRWFVTALSQFFQSEEQSVDFRTVVGGTVGRYIVQSNRTLLSLGGGIVANIEKFTGNETFDRDLEALVAVAFDKFLFDDPELDIATSFGVLPSLKTGRVRLDLRSRVRLELVKNLYWSVDLFDTFDSDPPAVAATRNDFGITTALGWTF